MLSFTRAAKWNALVEAVPAGTDIDEALFDDLCRQFLTTVCLVTPLEVSNFRTYLLGGPTKTRDESVQDLATFIERGSVVLGLMGGALLTDNEQKISFYNGCPKLGAMISRTQ